MNHPHDMPIVGSYNFGLVALSIIIAIIASSVALTLASRIRYAPADQRFRWLLAGAVAMGTGIWAMHFTGMLAYDLDMPVKYDVPTVALSLMAAIGAAAVALNVIYRKGNSPLRLVLGGTLMGAGIGAMHYIGMYAMRLEAHTNYDLRFFLLSVVVAVVVAIIALWFASQSMGDEVAAGGDLFAGAILMGMGIASMHYTAMVAASFQPTNEMVGSTAYALDLSRVWLGAIILVTLLILGATFRVGRGVVRQPSLSVASSSGGD
jgi:methyl-accepting chemotaxis protein PixJ